MTDYKDLRQQMHPEVAKSVPNTPEAAALLAGKRYRPMAFGGLVTKLVEIDAVPYDSREALKEGVCEILDIPEQQFDGFMAERETLPADLADYWARSYGIRTQREAKKQRQAAFREHIANRIVAEQPDKHLDELEKLTEEVQEQVDRVQKQLDEKSWSGFHSPEPRLERYLKPRLESLKASRFAINLPELIGVLQTDSLVGELPEEARGILLRHYGDSVAGSSDAFYGSPYQLVEAFEGDTEYWSDEDKSDFENVWLAEADLDDLADNYAFAYSTTTAGEEELDQVANPLADILFVSDAERDKFFESFPLAHGNKPR